MGLALVPPVSPPRSAGHDNDKVFLVDETKVMMLGRVGAIPAYARIGSDQGEDPTKLTA